MPAKLSQNIDFNAICPNYAEFDRRARQESKERISEHLAYRKDKISQCIHMVMEDVKALPVSVAEDVVFADDGKILSVAEQHVEQRINEWRGVQLKQCSKGVQIDTFEKFVKKAKNHQDQTSWKISGDYFFAPYIHKARVFLRRYCDCVSGVTEQEREEIYTLCCLAFAAALLCTRIKFHRTKPKPLMRYRTLVKSDGIHTALECLHPSLAVRAMIKKAKEKRKQEDNKSNVIVGEFCAKLEQFAHEQYMKQKERVYAFYKVAFDRRTIVNAQCAKDNDDGAISEMESEVEVDAQNMSPSSVEIDDGVESDQVKPCTLQCQNQSDQLNGDSDQVSFKNTGKKERIFQSIDVYKNKKDRLNKPQLRQKELRASRVDQWCMKTSSDVNGNCDGMRNASYCNLDRSMNVPLSLPNLQPSNNSIINHDTNIGINTNNLISSNPNSNVSSVSSVSALSPFTPSRLQVGAQYSHVDDGQRTSLAVARKMADLELQNDQLCAKVLRLERQLQEQYIHNRRLHAQIRNRDCAAAYSASRPVHQQLPAPPRYVPSHEQTRIALPHMTPASVTSCRHVTTCPHHRSSFRICSRASLPIETYHPSTTTNPTYIQASQQRQQAICAPLTTTFPMSQQAHSQPSALRANQIDNNLSPNMVVLPDRDWTVRSNTHSYQHDPFAFNGNRSIIRSSAPMFNSVFST